MQLCYRGAKYQTQIKSVNTVETRMTAKFLGRAYTLRQTICQSPLSSDLYKYRGIIYQK